MKLKGQKPGAVNASGNWPFVLDGAVGKRLNPVPLQGNSCLGYVGSNPASASRKEKVDATSTMTEKLLTEATAL